MKVAELKKLPVRPWDKETTYHSLLVIPSGKKHDSGYAIMYIIGCDEKNVPIEIAAACDDIVWKIPEKVDYDLRNDMFYPSGVLRYHSHKYDFRVGYCTSSTDIFLIPSK